MGGKTVERKKMRAFCRPLPALVFRSFQPQLVRPLNARSWCSKTDSNENTMDDELLDLLASQGIKAEDLKEKEDSPVEKTDLSLSDFSEAELMKKTSEEQLEWIKQHQSVRKQTDFDVVKSRFDEEGDPNISIKDISTKISDFCPKTLRKWVDDAVGALVGKGYYDEEGNWVEYTKLDMDNPQARLRLQDKPPTPALTFRVTKMPGGQEGFAKRAYNPPEEKTRLPSDLEGKYRFGLTPELVAELDLSPKLKKVLSFAYANKSEIRTLRIQEMVEKWGNAKNDCGNTAVQLCIMTQKIQYLTEHLKTHRKDQCARRRLQIIVANRRNLFKYLKRRDVHLYYQLLKDQAIKDKFLMHGNE